MSNGLAVTDSRQSNSKNKAGTRVMNVITALALLFIAAIISLIAIRENPPATAVPNDQDPSHVAPSPVRARLCSIIRRIDAARYPWRSYPASSTSPELFEFLGLDPAKPPFYPSCAMARPETPSQGTCSNAIRVAWLAKLDEIGFSECAGIGTGTGKGTGNDMKATDEAELQREETVAGVQEKVLFGNTRHLDIESDCMELGRLVHAVAGALWNGESRADYVRYLLPVLRPRPGSAFSWSSAATLENMCPKEG